MVRAVYRCLSGLAKHSMLSVKGGLAVNDYWLVLFDQEPRRFRVIENLLKNRLSEATMFWAMVYGIQEAVAGQRQLKRAEFDKWMNQQVTAGLMVQEEGQAWLTTAGLVEKQRLLTEHYQPRFGNWGWRINPERLANRLLLGIQVVSEFAHHNRRYRPLNLGNYELGTVKQWLLKSGRGIQGAVEQQVTAAFAALEKVDPRLPQVLAALLIGHQTSGATLGQLARELRVSEGETAIIIHDAWLGLGAYLATTPGPLSQLVGPLIYNSPLTTSAQQTVADFLTGQSPVAISRRRHRKLSTIRDHLLTAAILTPGMADWRTLFPAGMLEELANRYQGPVASWQFVATHPDLDLNQEFFLFRLYQIMRCQNSDH